MKVKSALLLGACLIILWLFWGQSSYPTLQEVYEREKTLVAARSPSTSASGLSTPGGEPINISQFEAWQSSTRTAYQNLLSIGDDTADSPKVEVVRSMPEKAGVIRKYFELLSRDGMRIPGVLQYPKGAKNLPGVLLIPGHTRPEESGLSQLVDEEESYQHAAATKLAHEGYVTIVIELRGFGLLGLPKYPEHKIVAYNQILKGSSYKALVLGDLTDILRYLEELEITDPFRIAVAGASLGGELSVDLGALETSIKAIAFSAHFGRGAFKPFGAGSIKQPHYCHLIPNIGSIMRKEDLFKLLVPRATIGIRDVEVAQENRYSSIVKNLKRYVENIRSGARLRIY